MARMEEGDFAEYFPVGTLASVLLTLGVAALVRVGCFISSATGPVDGALTGTACVAAAGARDFVLRNAVG